MKNYTLLAVATVASTFLLGAGQPSCAPIDNSENLRSAADPCAAMDAREGPDTCDGGGWGYKWDGSQCVYQGDLCNCIGADCLGAGGEHGGLFESKEACLTAFADCGK